MYDNCTIASFLKRSPLQSGKSVAFPETAVAAPNSSAENAESAISRYALILGRQTSRRGGTFPEGVRVASRRKCDACACSSRPRAACRIAQRAGGTRARLRITRSIIHFFLSLSLLSPFPENWVIPVKGEGEEIRFPRKCRLIMTARGRGEAGRSVLREE